MTCGVGTQTFLRKGTRKDNPSKICQTRRITFTCRKDECPPEVRTSSYGKYNNILSFLNIISNTDFIVYGY